MMEKEIDQMSAVKSTIAASIAATIKHVDDVRAMVGSDLGPVMELGGAPKAGGMHQQVVEELQQHDTRVLVFQPTEDGDWGGWQNMVLGYAAKNGMLVEVTEVPEQKGKKGEERTLLGVITKYDSAAGGSATAGIKTGGLKDESFNVNHVNKIRVFRTDEPVENLATLVLMSKTNGFEPPKYDSPNTATLQRRITILRQG